MHGETGTPYSDGRWLLFIEFPQIYPQQPPEIRFITKIYHCNINDDVCCVARHKTILINLTTDIINNLHEGQHKLTQE